MFEGTRKLENLKYFLSVNIFLITINALRLNKFIKYCLKLLWLLWNPSIKNKTVIIILFFCLRGNKRQLSYQTSKMGVRRSIWASKIMPKRIGWSLAESSRGCKGSVDCTSSPRGYCWWASILYFAMVQNNCWVTNISRWRYNITSARLTGITQRLVI